MMAMTAFVGQLTLAAFLFVSATAEGTSLSGKWKIDGDVVGNPIQGVCTMNQDGAKISGSCLLGDRKVDITGEVTEKKVVWKFDSDYNGQPLVTTFSGTINETGSKLSGGIEVAPFNVSGEFTATREEAKK